MPQELAAGGQYKVYSVSVCKFLEARQRCIWLYCYTAADFICCLGILL